MDFVIFSFYVRSSIVTEQVVQFIVIQQVFIELEIIMIAVGDHSLNVSTVISSKLISTHSSFINEKKFFT